MSVPPSESRPAELPRRRPPTAGRPGPRRRHPAARARWVTAVASGVAFSGLVTVMATSATSSSAATTASHSSSTSTSVNTGSTQSSGSASATPSSSSSSTAVTSSHAS